MARTVRQAKPTDAKNGRTCYVAAPTQFSRRKLEAAIREAGFEPVDATDFQGAGRSASEAVLATLKRVDAVVGVLSPSESANVLIELGMAVALGKRVIVLGEVKRQPPQLAEAVWLRAAPDDYEPVRFALSHLEEACLTKKPSVRRRRSSQATSLEVAPTPAEAFNNERSLIAFLADIFESAGGIAIGRETPNDRFDLGLWSDDASWVVGNPIMVEVKTKIDSPERFTRVVAEMEHRLAGTNIEWAPLTTPQVLIPRLPSKQLSARVSSPSVWTVSRLSSSAHRLRKCSVRRAILAHTVDAWARSTAKS